MLKKIAWAPTIYTLAISIIVACGIMGVMMVKKAMQPYYEMVDIPNKLYRGELRYFKTGEESSRIFAYIHEASTDISRHQYNLAEEKLNKAQALDPDNSLFEYLKASIYYKNNDLSRMWKHIRAGNDMGKLQLHSSRDVPPDSWTHPEISLLRQMAVTMARSISSKDELWELVRMGNTIIHTEPIDVDQLFMGLSMREVAVKKLRAIAKSENDTRLYDLCNALIREKAATSLNYDEMVGRAAFRKIDIPTMLIAMAHYRRNPNVRLAYWIDLMQKQSEAVAELRQKTITTPVTKTP